jgi:lipopolysaccharide/colanic/teichoic acid biosynthesis glycosyltransferase
MGAQLGDALLTADEVVIDLREPVTSARPMPAPALVELLGLDIEVPAGVYLRVVKPVIDRALALVALLVILPAMLAIALVLRVRLGRGILFRQERIGRGGVPFTVYKFRTMLPDRRRDAATFVGTDRRVTHKSVDDPRHTRVGQFLRRWSLDELPQLLNVLRGEMSLVGPRPELPHVVQRYEPWEHVRHVVRPGLTGFWQTTARADGPMKDFTHLDLDYVRQVSFLTDLRLLVLTPFAALGAHKGC